MLRLLVLGTPSPVRPSLAKLTTTLPPLPVKVAVRPPLEITVPGAEVIETVVV